MILKHIGVDDAVLKKYQWSECRRSSQIITQHWSQWIITGGDSQTFGQFGCRGAALDTKISNIKYYLRSYVFSPVLLADKQIEGILCPQKVVIIQDFNCTHPVRIEVTCNLTKKNMSELDKTVKNTEGTPASFLSPSQHCIIYEKEGADSKTSAGIETLSISTSTRAVEFLNSLEEIHILKNENNYNTLRHWFCLCRFASGCILWAAWSDQQPHKHRSASI